MLTVFLETKQIKHLRRHFLKKKIHLSLPFQKGRHVCHVLLSKLIYLSFKQKCLQLDF